MAVFISDLLYRSENQDLERLSHLFRVTQVGKYGAGTRTRSLGLVKSVFLTIRQMILSPHFSLPKNISRVSQPQAWVYGHPLYKVFREL